MSYCLPALQLYIQFLTSPYVVLLSDVLCDQSADMEGRLYRLLVVLVIVTLVTCHNVDDEGVEAPRDPANDEMPSDPEMPAPVNNEDDENAPRGRLN